MAPSNAPRTSRGGHSPNGRHARRSHDAGEDALFALSLDDVMSDRPWTADELTGGSVGPAAGNAPASDAGDRGAHRAGHAAAAPGAAPTKPTAPAGTPRPASDPSETAAFLAAAAQRYTPSTRGQTATMPHREPDVGSETVAMPAMAEAAAAQRPTPATGMETVAMPAMATAAAQRPAPTPTPTAPDPATRPVMPASAPAAPEPSTLEPPVMDLDDLSHRQFAFDAWAATDLDETSAGMPALDAPVNPLYAGPDPSDEAPRDYDPRADRDVEDLSRRRIETEDYGTVDDDYPIDPFAPAPEYVAPAYTTDAAGTGEAADDRFADYYVEEEPPHFSQFSQTAKVVFIAIVVALLGLIGFEGFQLFHGATKAESEVQQKEDENTDYLDINTLSDPNEGSSSE